MLPDDVIAAEKPCLPQMVEAYADIGGNMVAAMKCRRKRPPVYGVLDVSEDMARWSRCAHGREAERPRKRPRTSRSSVATSYAQVLENLSRMKQGAGGEIQ